MSKLADHFFVGCGGELLDTRLPKWSDPKNAIRKRYQGTRQHITDTTDLKCTLRSGQYAWPGGYPMYFITADGGALTFDTVRENLREILDSIRNKLNDGWRVIACEVNWENTNLIDDHTGLPIESAYGDD